MDPDLANVSALCLTAPADGVAPALLLSIMDTKLRMLGQYMFNAPEGISRLMLEHRARPSLHFKALFLSGISAAESGGLAGLVLRLKQDGHGSLLLAGPQGTSDCLQGIKPFIHWHHPHIYVSEATVLQPLQQMQAGAAAAAADIQLQAVKADGAAIAAEGTSTINYADQHVEVRQLSML
eukprot:GHRR01026561.1.p1 GENE.GHRR01026561.1~~GHRR01026561.1.p1  ORF type:complete len:180 (+),score=59.33 GHRR01026561.1:350-889(+)